MLICACEYPDYETVFSEHGVLPDGSEWREPVPDIPDDPNWMNHDIGVQNPIDTNGLVRAFNMDLIDIFSYQVGVRYNLDLFRDYDIKETGIIYRGSVSQGWIKHQVPYDINGDFTDTISVDMPGLMIECFAYARDAFNDTLRSDTLIFKTPLVDLRTSEARNVADSSAYVDVNISSRFYDLDSLRIVLLYSNEMDTVLTDIPYFYPCRMDSTGSFTCFLERLQPNAQYRYLAHLKYRGYEFYSDTKYLETDSTATPGD